MCVRNDRYVLSVCGSIRLRELLDVLGLLCTLCGSEKEALCMDMCLRRKNTGKDAHSQPGDH